MTAVAAALFVSMPGAAVRAEGLTRVGRQARPEELRREQAIMEAAGIHNWPKSQRLTVAPLVDKSLLSNPALVTRENRSYAVIVLDEAECGSMCVTWRRVVPSDAPLPTELPAEMRAQLDEHTPRLPSDMRQQFLERELERYRRSKATVLKGEIDVRIAVAPSSRAAQEYLIYESTICALPTEAVTADFGESRKRAGLGDVAYQRGGLVRFVRDNVAVILDGRGDFVAEVEQLAKKIDAAIVKQPALKSLQAGRPTLVAGKLRSKSVAYPSHPAYSFTATAPAGASIARVQATINGQPAPVKDQEVVLESNRGQLALKISAIADTLLVTSIEKTVLVSAE